MQKIGIEIYRRNFDTHGYKFCLFNLCGNFITLDRVFQAILILNKEFYNELLFYFWCDA